MSLVDCLQSVGREKEKKKILNNSLISLGTCTKRSRAGGKTTCGRAPKYRTRQEKKGPNELKLRTLFLCLPPLRSNCQAKESLFSLCRLIIILNTFLASADPKKETRSSSSSWFKFCCCFFSLLLFCVLLLV